MLTRAALVLLVMYLGVPVCADTLLWDNGAPDWRYAIPAPTEAEDAEPTAAVPGPGFCERADEFENDAPWKVTAISVRGLFPLGSDQEPDQLKKSDRIEVKIYRPDAKGLPGELFWSTKLQGEAAWASQTFGGEVPLSRETLSDHHRPADDPNAPLGKLLEIEVRDPKGLVTLPPGKWFVSWRVQRSEWKVAQWGGLIFEFLSAAYPRPGFDGDRPFCGSSMVYWALKEAGDSILMWVCPGKSNRPAPIPDMKYNLSFRILGEKQ